VRRTPGRPHSGLTRSRRSTAWRRPGVWLLVAILAVGAGLRAEQAADPTTRPGADERAYARNAIALTRGRYASVHWPPAAPALFAVARTVGGDGARPSGAAPGMRAAYWAQAVVGTLTILAAYALAAIVAGGLAGLLAAAVVAVYPPFVVGAAHLLSEPLAGLFVTSALAVLAHAVGHRTPLRWLALAGLLFGCAVLTKANLLAPLLALAVCVAATLAVRSRRLGPGLAAGGAFAGAAASLIVPWSVAASVAKDELVVVAADSAAPFFVGTLLPADGRVFAAKRHLAPEVRAHVPRLRGAPVSRIHGSALFSAVAARRPDLPHNQALTAEAWANVRRYGREDPVAFAGLLLSKVPRLWWNYGEGRRQLGGIRLVLHRILILACALALAAGIVRTRHPALVAVAVVALALTALHMVAIAYPRYVRAVMPAVFAASAAAAVLVVRPRAPEPAGSAAP
jgi:hypothetical protein